MPTLPTKPEVVRDNSGFTEQPMTQHQIEEISKPEHRDKNVEFYTKSGDVLVFFQFPYLSFRLVTESV
jgi:hypothetical protein